MNVPMESWASLERCIYAESEYVLDFAVASLVYEKLTKIWDYSQISHAEIGLIWCPDLCQQPEQVRGHEV